MRVSNSMLEVWMKCPMQAKFKYLLRLPTRKTSRMTFGNCVHAALESYNVNGDIDKAIALFEDLWDNPEKINCEVEIWPKGSPTHGGFRTKGIEMLRVYHDKQGWESREIIAQEHKFLVPIGDHEISGVVDLLEVRKSGRGKSVLRVVDYKTGSKQPYKDNIRVNTQFTTYDFASRQPEFWMGNKEDMGKYPPIAANAKELYERFKDVPRRGIWFHLLTCKEIDAGPRDEGDFMRLYRVICEITRAIEHEVFVPCISGETCTFCDFTEPCGVKIPERDYDEDDNDEHWF